MKRGCQFARSLQGISLVEVLMVVLIIAILLGVLSPVLVSSKRRAHEINELARLKQIGQSYELYSTDFAKPAYGNKYLVNGGYLPASICSSPLDHSIQGQSNNIVNALAQRSTAYIGVASLFRNSFPGIYEYQVPNDIVVKWINEERGGGWLVSLTRSKPTEYFQIIGPFTGRYSRLLFDGSVVSRNHTTVLNNEGQKVWSPVFLFVDGEEWKQAYANK